MLRYSPIVEAGTDTYILYNLFTNKFTINIINEETKPTSELITRGGFVGIARFCCPQFSLFPVA